MKYVLGEYPRDDEAQKIEVQVDDWDTINVDHTICCMALPLLQKFREEYVLHTGAFLVAKEDLPYDERYKELSSRNYSDLTFEEADEHHEIMRKRSLWVLDEILFSLGSVAGDVDELCDDSSVENLLAHARRVHNGFVLFGKYLQALWF